MRTSKPRKNFIFTSAFVMNLPIFHIQKINYIYYTVLKSRK